MALLTRVGESVKHVAGGYKLRNRPLEFAAIGEYLDTFALKLGTIDRIAQRIIKEEIGELCVKVWIRPANHVCRNGTRVPGRIKLLNQGSGSTRPHYAHKTNTHTCIYMERGR